MQEFSHHREQVEETIPANLHEIRSPIVGTFYRAPAPDADNYGEIGDMVSPGTVLCIVEAMKLMNEIEADVSGKISKILVESGKPVDMARIYLYAIHAKNNGQDTIPVYIFPFRMTDQNFKDYKEKYKNKQLNINYSYPLIENGFEVDTSVFKFGKRLLAKSFSLKCAQRFSMEKAQKSAFSVHCS